MKNISDVIIQSLVNDIFWLAILVTILVLFRNEIRNLLASLGSAKVAGASFEFKDSRSTIESYVVLTNIMLDVLCNRESAGRMSDLLSDLHVRQLASFAVKYAKEVPADEKQMVLLTNIAFVVGRRGDVESAIQFYDSILKDRPDDLDILNLKASALGDTNNHEFALQAEKIQDDLVKMRPRDPKYRFNRALLKARLSKYQDAIADLGSAVDLDYLKRRKDMLTLSEFKVLRGMPEFIELEKRARERKDQLDI